MSQAYKILLIDDEADFRRLLSVRLKKLYPEAVIDEYDILAKEEFPSENYLSAYDVLFLDHDLRGKDSGITWYKSCQKRKNFPATIMITSIGNQTTAMHALNSGVHYYMTKQDLSEQGLKTAVSDALATRKNRSQISLDCQ